MARHGPSVGVRGGDGYDGPAYGAALIDSGLVRVTDWRPEAPLRPGTPPIGIFGGVARRTDS
ncbi:hypothetical protein RKD18_006610 [Streptomyces phaeoluteigriseus]